MRSVENVTLGNSISNAKGVGDFFRLVVEQTTPIFRKPMLANTLKLSYSLFVVFAISNGTFLWYSIIAIKLADPV